MNFSYSAISSFQSCPRSFEFKYIKKEPEAFQSVERHMGLCVHEVIRQCYQERGDGREPSAETVRKWYEHHWRETDLEAVRVVKSGRCLSEYFEDGWSMLDGFFHRVFPVDTSSTLNLEHRFNIQLDDRIAYRGIIDRLSRQPSGLLRITDFKTGRVSHPLDDLQLPSYALYAFSQFGEEQLELSYEDLKTQQSLVAVFQKREGDATREHLLREIRLIQDADGYPTRPSQLCMRCGYNVVCENPHFSVQKRPKRESDRQSEAEANGDHPHCPECGTAMRKRKSRFGPFWGCGNYPECTHTMEVEEKGKEKRAEEICPECGGHLQERKGKFGRFWGCSNYPECRFTRKREAGAV